MEEEPLNPIPILAGAVLAGAAALAFHAFCIEPVWVDVSRRSLPLPDLPADWEGARVVHLSDLHYGDPRSEHLFRRMVREVNALFPDLVVITGDFVVRLEREVAPCVKHLAQLRARHGVYGVLGDHDFYGPRGRKVLIPGIVESLEGSGVRLLRNAAAELPGGLRLAGVEPTTHKVQRADIDAALAGLNGRPPHLFLSHSPDIIEEASTRDVPLVLCGHTHGGQVVAPFYGPPVTHIRLHRKHASGWSELGNTRMYTCRGLGSHFSVRFLCRPEIAVFTLTKK